MMAINQPLNVQSNFLVPKILCYGCQFSSCLSENITSLIDKELGGQQEDFGRVSTSAHLRDLIQDIFKDLNEA